MKKIIGAILFSLLLAGCSSNPPKPPLPKGDWVPVNSIDVGQGG